jgi:hypothetical protein
VAGVPMLACRWHASRVVAHHVTFCCSMPQTVIAALSVAIATVFSNRYGEFQPANYVMRAAG